MSPGALLFQAIDLPGLYALGETVRPGLFEEPKKTLAPLSHQAPWRSGSFKSHDGCQQAHWSHPGCHFWQRLLQNESEAVCPGSLKSLNVHTTCFQVWASQGYCITKDRKQICIVLRFPTSLTKKHSVAKLDCEQTLSATRKPTSPRHQSQDRVICQLLPRVQVSQSSFANMFLSLRRRETDIAG